MTLTENRPAAAASEAARRAMIDSQLRTSGVNEPWVLAAMARVPREDFVPEAAKAAAYIDRAVPLGEGRFLAAPLVQGMMLSEAKPSAEDKALLIGDANGYLAALLGPLVGSLEAADPADVSAKKKNGPYTLIVVDGAIEELPGALATQLAEGGRIVTGLVLRSVTRLAAGRKAAGEVALLPLAEIGIPVLPEFAAPKRWSF
ncbi:protein-L-isoaspartate O-methyltransferase [Novosphingobium sp. G106]|uniref:protein-L-isoaspartate O-methyltransferase family protein n=1 Tax=Novosphingobium sp. G106 TaxID=2849500 RepID=UPI001C2CD933|nr:protein-L-isoaspartate O-methyltransferase [Novosphingobium sp. G106]MBV1689957.1 protein-L-isoaspartate O-methyltransferase [Novosphingobium sp. G106]